MKINDIITFLETKYPLDTASDFDEGKIGLILGSSNYQLDNILLALDLNLDVVTEAKALNVNLIITHHPFIYKPITKIDYDSIQGQIISEMIKNNISLYVMHTNLDVGRDGVNDTLASLIGLQNIIGIPQKDQYLRYGKIKPVSLEKLALQVKDKLQLTGVRVAGNLQKQITTVGIIGGSGAQIEEIENAIAVGCDCYITGEVKLNVAQYAISNGLSIIEVNHGVERFVFDNTRNLLETRLQAKKKVFISKINTDPLISL